MEWIVVDLNFTSVLPNQCTQEDFYNWIPTGRCGFILPPPSLADTPCAYVQMSAQVPPVSWGRWTSTREGTLQIAVMWIQDSTASSTSRPASVQERISNGEITQHIFLIVAHLPVSF